MSEIQFRTRFQREKIEKMKFKELFMLIILSFELCEAKVYDACEFVKEIHTKYNVTKEEIYKHLCVATVSLDTTIQTDKENGIYGIGSEWWCREDEAGGGCNLKCSNLRDDDISDDISCAKKILSQQGVEAWNETDDECNFGYQNLSNVCLALLIPPKNNTSTVSENSTVTNDTDKLLLI